MKLLSVIITKHKLHYMLWSCGHSKWNTREQSLRERWRAIRKQCFFQSLDFHLLSATLMQLALNDIKQLSTWVEDAPPRHDGWMVKKTKCIEKIVVINKTAIPRNRERRKELWRNLIAIKPYRVFALTFSIKMMALKCIREPRRWVSNC